MADRGAQLALNINYSPPASDYVLPEEGYTYNPPASVTYGANLASTYPPEGTGGTTVPTEGQLWPRENS